MATVHLLSQYIWPDGGPDGILAEQLATRLYQHGHDIRLIGGRGTYRRSGRAKPEVPLLHLDHYCGRRGNLRETFAQYCAVKNAFRNYINKSVNKGDVVVVTSAPPTTVSLAASIKQRGAHAIYWLQDYYPELIRSLYDYPKIFCSALCAYWDAQLGRWDRVVKSAGNLGRALPNAIVIRNWPTLEFDEVTEPEPRTALYSGNLSYGHDVSLVVAACEKLRDEGYRITVRADGSGVQRLPAWLRAQPLHPNPESLKEELIQHEVHLIAAHPRIQRAMFPSKIWNSIALGRRLVCTGFAGEMVSELEQSKRAPFSSHLDQWMDLLLSVEPAAQPTLAVAG